MTETIDQLMLVTFMPATSILEEHKRRKFWRYANARSHYAMREQMQERFYQAFGTQVVGRLMGISFHHKNKYEILIDNIAQGDIKPEQVRDAVMEIKAIDSVGYWNHTNGIDFLALKYLGQDKEIIPGFMIKSVAHLQTLEEVNMNAFNVERYKHEPAIVHVRMKDGAEYAGFTILSHIIHEFLYVNTENSPMGYRHKTTLNYKDMEKITVLEPKSHEDPGVLDMN